MPNDFVTPETTEYLVLGMVIVFTLIGGYVASLFVRVRSTQADLHAIEQAEQG